MTWLCRILITVSLLATITSTLTAYPHQLAYFNEAAGGPENGHKHLLGSNLDWGQDYLFVQDWMLRSHIPPSSVSLVSYSQLPRFAAELIGTQSASNQPAAWQLVSWNRSGQMLPRHLRGLNPQVGSRVGYTHHAIPSTTLPVGQ